MTTSCSNVASNLLKTKHSHLENHLRLCLKSYRLLTCEVHLLYVIFEILTAVNMSVLVFFNLEDAENMFLLNVLYLSTSLQGVTNLRTNAHSVSNL
jgi:hypothetical protein